MSSPEDHDALAWLFGLQRFGMEPGLERTRALLAAVGEPQADMEVVLVGGTNGKGSVTAVLAACFQAAGRRTGSFFSPHLERVGERARVDGVEATRAQMNAAVEAVRPHAERLGATFFEVVTVAALKRFAAAGVRVAVMEVGLGGRLDATNALEPQLSLITSVGLDHTAVLGPDLESVAAEKAGILRPGVPALTSARGAALEVIVERASWLGAPLLVLNRDFRYSVERLDWAGIELELSYQETAEFDADAGGRSTSLDPAPGGPGAAGAANRRLRLSSPLLGTHQAENVALAAMAALQAGVSPETVRRAVVDTRWPGRLEVFEYEGRRFVLDGAHNPQAATSLASALERLDARATVVVLGVSADKDLEGLLPPLAGLAETVVATHAALSPRALAAGELAERLTPLSAAPPLIAGDPKAALQAALDASTQGATVVVAGSLFLVGEFRSLLTGAATEAGQRWQ